MKPTLTDDRHFQECYALREKAIEALIETLSQLEIGVSSEKDAQELLSENLRKRDVHDYWYPAGEEGPDKQSQFGILCIFFDPDSEATMTYTSGREMQVRENTKWQGLGYFYASPFATYEQDGLVHGAWGDMGLTVYTGDDPKIRKAFRSEHELVNKLLDHVKEHPEITTADLYGRYVVLCEEYGVTNTVKTKTGLATGQSSTNIGHSFPNVGVKPGDADGLKKLMSDQRKFVDDTDPISLEGNIWTLESRDLFPGFEDIGNLSFHMVYAVRDKKFIALLGYDELFKRIGMDWVVGD